MRDAILTKGPVAETILSQTLPMMIGMVAMVAFNLIDTFFVGKLGKDALAAMSFTLPVIMLEGAIAMGLGMGASTVISHAIGRGDQEAVKRLTTDSLVLSVLIVLITVIVGLLTMDPLFRLLGAEGEHLELVKQYMRIWYPGVVCVVIPMVGNAAIRAAGNTRIPSMLMLCAIGINLVLDPLLIFGIGIFPRWELAGAAAATVVSRATTLVVVLVVLHKRFNMLTAARPTLRELLNSWKQLLSIGVPAMLTQLLVPLTVGLLMRLISTFGAAAVAATGLAYRIEMFALSPLMALSAVIVPFVGQNSGANLPERVREGIDFSYRFAMLLGAGVFLLFMGCGHWIVDRFTTDPETAAIGTAYLGFIGIGFAGVGVARVSEQSFNALKKPLYATALVALRMLVLLLPMALLGAHLYGIVGLYAGAGIGSALAGVIAVPLLQKKL